MSLLYSFLKPIVRKVVKGSPTSPAELPGRWQFPYHGSMKNNIRQTGAELWVPLYPLLHWDMFETVPRLAGVHLHERGPRGRAGDHRGYQRVFSTGVMAKEI